MEGDEEEANICMFRRHKNMYWATAFSPFPHTAVLLLPLFTQSLAIDALSWVIPSS